MSQPSQSSQPFGTVPPDSSGNNLRFTPPEKSQISFQRHKTTPKPPFLAFIREFPSSIYYFSQNKNTSHLIDHRDVELIIDTTKERSKLRKISIVSIGAVNLAITTLLQRKSKIFGLTYRVSFPSLLAKYILLPLFGTSVLDALIFRPKYAQVYQRIKSKYDFQDPVFVHEYELDPNPYSTINSFVNHKFGSVH